MISQEIEEFLINVFDLVNVKDCSITKLTDGLSGAAVYILEIKNSRNKSCCGIYILKIIDTLAQWHDRNNNEVDKSKEIYSNAINFQKHLVKVIADKVIDNQLVMILSYAFSEKMSLVSLAQLRVDNKLEILEHISYDLLSEFNKNRVEFVEECEVIDKLCAYRIKENGNFRKRIKEYVYEERKPAINIDGCVLPNPNYYVDNLNKILKEKGMQYVQYIKGFTHGDMHQKNILTLKNSDQYVIIDYDSCTNNYLLFDQAYLELNCYMQISETWDIETWLEGMEYMFQTIDTKKNNIQFAGIIEIERRIRKGIEKWYLEELPNSLDSFHVQLQLARIAAGINFFSKSGITEHVEQIKYLIYTAYGFKALFSLINYQWEKENVSRLTNKQMNSENIQQLWNECGRMRSEYIKILITDDIYDQKEYAILSKLGKIDWKLIVDVGEKVAPNDLFESVVPIVKEYNSIRYITEEEIDNVLTYRNTNLLQIKKGKDMSLFEHWKKFKQRFVPIYKRMCSSEPLKSVLFILDFHNDSTIRERLIEMLGEENLIRKTSRFICFGKKHELAFQDKDFEENKIKYFEHECMNLEDIAKAVEYYGLHRDGMTDEIILPSIDSLDGQLTREKWNDYNSVVEIVYSGIENNLTDDSNGEQFYRGNEITWLDIVQKRDIEWNEYNKWKEIIIKKLQNDRISECKLLHGAGAGGTTLSRRLMWDIKDTNPTLRLRKFDSDAANIIVDIYRKTGKSVFVVVEMGSTIISEDEYECLKRDVNAQSSHALFLKVERATLKEEEQNAEIYLREDLSKVDAKKFYDTYYKLTNDTTRKKYLSFITYNFMENEWKGQRCPFFYGFYTFQEEYRGIGSFLKSGIVQCDKALRTVLCDLAIVTVYSQNICMPYEEVAHILQTKDVLLGEIYEKINSGIQKILIEKEKGFRICHPLIARKLLELLYDDYKAYGEQLYHATSHFIDNKHAIYGEIDREYLDKLFKELFIDRSYIDGEQQKFAQLINELERPSFKINIFEKLKKLYGDNPHYYNHLGRLEIYDKNNRQFDKAITNLKKALEIAEKTKYSQVPHYTTLGCIYSVRIAVDVKMKEQSIEQMLENIWVDFDNANDCFSKAREIKENSTYGYFPNILMITNTVKNITNVTGRSLEKLLENEKFKKWYDTYSGIAIQLYAQMIRNCAEELSDELKRKAEESILHLNGDVKALKSRLEKQRKSGLKIKECNNLGRTVCMLLYMQNEYKWENLRSEELHYVKNEMENILEAGEYNQNDVNAWFSVYRQMNDFDYGKAKRYLEDYMEEGYYKNYLLWILNFAEYQQGMQPYSQVLTYLNACRYNRQLAEKGIRTTQSIDTYTIANKGFPIKRISSVRGDDGEYHNLKTFRGKIYRLEGTAKGIIKLDGLDDIIVTFIPSFMVGDQRMEFTRVDISSNVEFNLMFTYSGYKAWNPRKVL